MAVLGDMSTVSLFNVLGLFKSEEQKKKEYEDNIATNVAAMEVQNRANEGTAYSNDPRFQTPTGPAAVNPVPVETALGPNDKVYVGLGGIVYPGESSIYPNYTVDTLPENIKEMQRIRYERNLAAPNIMNMKPTLANINSTTKTPNQVLLETKAKPFSPQQQIDLAAAETLVKTPNVLQSQLQKGIGSAYNLDTGKAATTAATATGGMDYMNLLKILGMVNSGSQTQSNVKPAITPGITPAVAGTKIQDEDLYARYRR